MPDVRFFLLDGDPRQLVKTEDWVGYLWRDGAWVRSNYLGAKVTGAGGDCDFRTITREEADAFIAAATPAPPST
jgi:hypothetical protein